MARSTVAFFSVFAIASVDAMELTQENWDQHVQGKTVFIKFFAPWCGHCKKIKPDWDRLMLDFKGSPTGLVAEVDCTGSGKALCESHSIKGYPNIMWGKADSLQPYQGQRSYVDMKRFSDENLGESCGPGNLELCDEKRKGLFERFKRMPPDVLDEKIKGVAKQMAMAEQYFQVVERNKTIAIERAEQKKKEDIDAIKKQNEVPQVPHKEGDFELTPENWDAKTKGKAIFVKFFAPWCGHCKAMKADWEKLMLDFHGTSTALVAEVDCTTDKGRELCDDKGVTGFPRLLWGVSGAPELLKHQGARDYATLKMFAREVLGEPCGPENLQLCEPSHKQLMEEFAKMTPEKRKARVQATEKAIDKAEKDFQDTHFSLLAAIDIAEEEKNKKIKAIKETGLTQAVQTQAWNKKQPPGFWKPPAHANADILFTVAGIDVTEFWAAAFIVMLFAIAYSLYLARRSPGKACCPRHILMKTEEDILKAKARIDAGEDFEKVCSECSTCKSRENGGALGTRIEGSMEPAVDKICFDPATKIGEVVGPVSTKFGFHLIRIDSRTGSRIVETAKNK